MPKITVLPEYIASQIAAGEVVERPSSVVKELVENSIDSGASQIEIAIGSGCRDIRIADDGCGMTADDAVLAFHRHATSKLSTAEDLHKLRTLGFRGEALPSIASVSKMTCLTRTADAANGTKIEAAEGNIKATETGCAVGTVMEVNDLFYNVPARAKFLKKDSTEFAHIHEIVQSLAIAYPKIVFQLLNQGEVVLKTSGGGKLAEAMVEVGMLSGKEELLTITDVDMRFGLAVYGYAVRAPHCRGDKKGILTVVNNRPVKCALTYKALDYAFSDLIPKGKSPIAVVTITLDPNQVDVNVHPMKKEIKYSNSSDVYLAIQKALVSATRAATVVKEEAPPAAAEEAASVEEAPVETAARVSEEEPSVSAAGGGTRELAIANSQAREIPAGGARTYQRIQQLGLRDRFTYNAPSRITNTQIQRPVVKQLPVGWRLAGYIMNTYLLFETPEGLRIIEQHIAHERCIYERVLAAQETPGRTTEMVQRLVISAPLELSPQQKSALAENLEVMQSLGFDFDFQPNSIACTQVPLELATKDYAGTVQQMVEQILSCDSAQLSLEASKSIACQAAIKNGMGLSEPEIVDLIAEWYECPRNDTCPHGRPVCLSYSKDQLFALFHPK